MAPAAVEPAAARHACRTAGSHRDLQLNPQPFGPPPDHPHEKMDNHVEEVTAKWDEEVSWFHASCPLNPINNLEVGLVPNAALAGSIERTHRPGASPVRIERQEQGHSILLDYLSAASVGLPSPSTFTEFSISRPRSTWGGNPTTAFRSSRHEITLVVLGLASCSQFSLAKRGQRRTGPRAFWGAEPGVAVDKSLPSRRLAGAYRRPGAGRAGAG